VTKKVVGVFVRFHDAYRFIEEHTLEIRTASPDTTGIATADTIGILLWECGTKADS
jgi:hypothetical protein